MGHYPRLALVGAFLITPHAGFPAGMESPVVEWSRTFGGSDLDF